MIHDDELEIPDFLKRAETDRPVIKKKVERKRPRKASMVDLHLGDEVPKIGSGFRTVDVASEGPKWVFVVYGGERYRLKRKVWDTLKKVNDGGNTGGPPK